MFSYKVREFAAWLRCTESAHFSFLSFVFCSTLAIYRFAVYEPHRKQIRSILHEYFCGAVWMPTGRQIAKRHSFGVPFYYLVTRTGIEPISTAWEAVVLTVWPTGLGLVARLLYYFFLGLSRGFLNFFKNNFFDSFFESDLRCFRAAWEDFFRRVSRFLGI